MLEISDFCSRSNPAFVFDQQSAPDPECFVINVNSMNECNVIIVYHRVAVTFHWAWRKTVTATQENNCTSPTGISCQPLLMQQHSLFHFVSQRHSLSVKVVNVYTKSKLCIAHYTNIVCFIIVLKGLPRAEITHSVLLLLLQCFSFLFFSAVKWGQGIWLKCPESTASFVLCLKISGFKCL